MAKVAAPELTTRSILTGMLIGALLTPCNVYSGLKIGWSFNMSIAAALLSYAFWRVAEDLFGSRHWGLLENNINQTTASSAASIISGGLVAPIPALTLLTGQELSLTALWLWVFTVSALGIAVAVLMRKPMLARRELVFPAGVATAETVRQIYNRGREASARVRALFGALLVAAIVRWWVAGLGAAARWSPSGTLAHGITPRNLGLSLDPSLLMLGFGAIIGLRAGASLLVGAVLAWGLLGPWLIARGWAQAGAPDGVWFGALVEWLVWPGVTLMTSASLTSFALIIIAARKAGGAAAGSDEPALPIPARAYAAGLIAVTALAVLLQQQLFGIPLLAGLFAVALSFGLAIVAARVVGETGIPPIGAIGKIAQLSFGAAAPGNVTANLMGANVTGGAAGQCADLLNDLRAGQLLGATPWRQIVAQCFGVLVGALVGALSYRLLIPDPGSMLLTEQWPAPAVATWKAVAEVLVQGLAAVPEGSVVAVLLAAAAGVALACGEVLLPARWARWLPSGAALGLAFVIPAWISISLFLGAALAAILFGLVRGWAQRFVLVLAAGLVAGESLAGIASAALAALY